PPCGMILDAPLQSTSNGRKRIGAARRYSYGPNRRRLVALTDEAAVPFDGGAPGGPSTPSAGRLLLDEVFDCLGDGGFEVEELGPRRGDRDDDHLVVEALHAGHPVLVLLIGHHLPTGRQVAVGDPFDQ